MTSLIRGTTPMESGTTTARRAASTMTQEALAEIERIDSRLIGLDENLQHAMSDPGSEATPQLEREMLQAMARREWLLEQLLQMQQSGR
jgi:hypothetical protein